MLPQHKPRIAYDALTGNLIAAAVRSPKMRRRISRGSGGTPGLAFCDGNVGDAPYGAGPIPGHCGSRRLRTRAQS